MPPLSVKRRRIPNRRRRHHQKRYARLQPHGKCRPRRGRRYLRSLQGPRPTLRRLPAPVITAATASSWPAGSRPVGWPVTVTIVGNDRDIRGDANTARHKWESAGGDDMQFEATLLRDKQLVVDAILGTGLARDVDGEAKARHRLPSATAKTPRRRHRYRQRHRRHQRQRSAASPSSAAHTVTFVRPKLGHVLLPGKEHTGQLHVFDIGIRGEKLTPEHFLNVPSLWRDKFPFPGPHSHKYTRGHAIVMGGRHRQHDGRGQARRDQRIAQRIAASS